MYDDVRIRPARDADAPALASLLNEIIASGGTTALEQPFTPAALTDAMVRGDAGRAFALFYTGVIGAGGLASIAYGTIADHSSQTVGVMASALTAASIIPLVAALHPVRKTAAPQSHQASAA